MSEEQQLTGRARGRARGRSRLQPAPGPDPRRPSTIPPQLRTPEPIVEKQQELFGRAKGLPVRLTRQMEMLSMTGGAEGGETAPTRGSVRNRRYDELAVTKPPGIGIKQGSSGQTVSLRSNYFMLQTVTDWTLYQYRVDFAPDDERTQVRKGLLRVHTDTLGPFMFDGTLLFTTSRLHPEPMELYSARTSDDVKIRITIKFVADLVSGDPNYIQFFNIVLRKCMGGLNLNLVGREFYDAAAKVTVDKYNLELWPGYVTSIRQHETNLLLGVDLTNKIMRKDTAFQLYSGIAKKSEDCNKAFAQSLIGATVITPYNNRTYRVDDIDFDSSPLSTFEKGNERISYIDYYRTKYQINITNKQQPLLISKPKLRDIRGGRANNVVLIPELCCLTGLSDEMRSNFHLMRELDEHTRLHPTARMDKIISFFQRLTSNKQAKEELSLWNLKFSPDLVEFAGRILAPERIRHGRDEYSDGNIEADWTRSLRGHAMYRPRELQKWCVIFLRKSQRDVETFVRTLSDTANSLNMRIPPPIFEDIPDDRAGTYVLAIEKVFSKMSPQLIMCIVPNNRGDRYGAIKKKCYVDRAIPSQVVLSKNITSKNVMSIATKIAIQMNCKIGGSPWTVIVPFKKPVMIVGFDVCHDSMKGRSFGAMVASLDGAYSKYFSTVTPHTHGEELSNDLSIQLVKAVTVYRRDLGFLPPKIIIYRDGVGEGNERYVLDHEVKLIRSKLQDVYMSVQVPMAFIIVSKRINTRLFLNGGNPPPGTIADDVITSPIKYDFYLVSQNVRQGTVSPTSYNVIYDTTNLTPDIMQKLSYKMTHLYFNWSGTVRVPATVQYAHKLASMCGQHLHRQPNEALNELLYFL